MDSAELSRLLGVWTDADERLPDALARTISELVDHGFVPAGSTLPPQRELAQVLGVARGTVASALAMLEAGGYVVSTRGSGTRVRSGRVSAEHRAGGRLFSFTNAPRDVIDLSSGALPASAVTREVLSASLDGVNPYLETDGYFPAGLPVLRQAIAEHLTRDGVPTRPAEVLVTSGAQQATSLAIRGLLDPGDLVLTEDPSYRGALCALRDHGVRLEGVPLRDGGVDVGLVARAAVRRPAALYCQTSVHNPTGQSMTKDARSALAGVVNRHGLPVVEDCCSYDLTLSGRPASTLTGLVAPELHLSCWTMSKLFWGGLRVGWVRADEARIRRLVELRKVDDLATSIVDQLYAVRLLRRAAAARRERQAMLTKHLASTERVLREMAPAWTWRRIIGGSGLWVDTGTDAVAFVEQAKRAGVKLAAGPSFSPHDGHRTMLRLPLWHDGAELRRGLGAALGE